MKLDESDLEETYFPVKAERVDKSIGYVVIGLVVVLIFSLFVFGLNRIQSASSQSVGTRSPENEPPAADISDTVDSSKK